MLTLPTTFSGSGSYAAPPERSAITMTLSAAERSLLAEMPLHAITSVHGEAGLRERLAIEVSALPPGDHALVQATLELAARLHAGDRRQREPYVNHLLRVAIRIIGRYQVRDPEVACAALCTTPSKTTQATSPPAAASTMPSPRSALSSASVLPGSSPPSPTRTAKQAATSTSSTASTSLPAWKPIPGLE